MRIRLVPLVAVALSCMLLSRIVVLIAPYFPDTLGRLVDGGILVSSLKAETIKETKDDPKELEKKEKKEKEKEKKKEKEKEEKATEKPHDEEAKKDDHEEKKDGEEHKADGEAAKPETSTEPPAASAPSASDPEQDKRTFTKNQLDILESLSTRRTELETWERSISMKENVLRATELRVEGKISELQDLERQVKLLLDQYNEKQDMKIQSLVKIYENMKPKEAARIFEELDMDVLLQVIHHMKEARVAPILAQMDPKLAKDVTLRFAEEKKLRYPEQP